MFSTLNSWIITAGLGLLLALALWQNDRLTKENSSLGERLENAFNVNDTLNAEIENLLNAQKAQMEAITSAQTQKSQIAKNLREVRSEIAKNTSADAVSSFNFMLNRLWDDKNATKNED